MQNSYGKKCIYGLYRCIIGIFFLPIRLKWWILKIHFHVMCVQSHKIIFRGTMKHWDSLPRMQTCPQPHQSTKKTTNNMLTIVHIHYLCTSNWLDYVWKPLTSFCVGRPHPCPAFVSMRAIIGFVCFLSFDLIQSSYCNV